MIKGTAGDAAASAELVEGHAAAIAIAVHDIAAAAAAGVAAQEAIMVAAAEGDGGIGAQKRHWQVLWVACLHAQKSNALK